MGRRTVWLLAALVTVLPASAAAGQDDVSAVPRMSLADFKQGLEAGTVVAVDVRDGASFLNGHVPGAVSMPLADVQKRAAELKIHRKIIVTYCG